MSSEIHADIPTVPDLLFRASFDGADRADAAFGDPKLYKTLFGGKPETVFPLCEGRFGKALLLDGTNPGFRMAGNILVRRGTIAFWLRPGAAFPDGPEPVLYLKEGSSESSRPTDKIAIEADLGAGRLGATLRDRLRAPMEVAGACALKRETWHHVAFAWDERFGCRLYLDGEEVASNWGEGAFHYGRVSVGRMSLSGLEGGAAFDEVRIYGRALVAEEVRALTRGEDPPEGSGEAGEDREHRLEALGWGEEEIAEMPEVPGDGTPWAVRELLIADAASYRKPGWQAVDGACDTSWPLIYHPYIWDEGGGLHVRFEEGEPGFNALSLTGSFYGTLSRGGGTERPAEGEVVRRIDRGAYASWFRLEPPVDGPVSFFKVLQRKVTSNEEMAKNDASRIFNAAFFRAGAAGEVGEGTSYALGSGGSAEDPLVRSQLICHYAPEDRGLVGGIPEAADGRRDVAVAACRDLHLLTPPLREEMPLGALRFRLFLKGAAQGTPVSLTVHDPYLPWHDLGRFGFRIGSVERDTASVDLTLDLRDTVVRAGAQVWVTLTVGADATLLCGGERRSALELIPGEPEEALRQYAVRQKEILRNSFVCISEPRPWGNVGEDDAYLRGQFPQYEQMQRILDDLRPRLPEDETLYACWGFTHPKVEGLGDHVSIPAGPPKVPRWAFLQQRCHRMAKAFAYWWLDNRDAPNGELASWFGDDTDLVNEWVNLALISDPGGRLVDSVRRLAEFCWKGTRIYDIPGLPIIEDGLTTASHSHLHAYEDGVNVQCLMTLLDYGNPTYLERCMETARRYDGWLTAVNGAGERVFRSTYFSSHDLGAVGEYIEYTLMFHPGLALMWYSDNPTVKRIMLEYVETLYRRFGQGLTRGYGNEYLFLGLYLHTGDERCFGFAEEQLREGTAAYGLPWDDLRDLAAYRDRIVGAADGETFRTLGTENLGWTDKRYEAQYLAWKVTRQERYLVRALEEIYRRMAVMMPMYTEVSQSGDRVAVPKNVSDRMYLGGLAHARNVTYPFLAASYEGLNGRFAALVTENRTDRLRLWLTNFDGAPQSGMVRVWRLAPGRYRVTAGPDRDGAGRPDSAEYEAEMELLRFGTFPIDLPPGELWAVEVEQVAVGVPLYERPDLAVTADDMAYDAAEDVLTVPVHNIGPVDVASFEVLVQDERGVELYRRRLDGLAAPADLNPQVRQVRVIGAGARGREKIRVTVDAGGELMEMNRSNNEAILDLSRGS